MPTYEYVCPSGHSVDVSRPVDKRDNPVACPDCAQLMHRKPAAGMAVLWQGKFHDPWAQKKPDALGDRTW